MDEAGWRCRQSSGQAVVSTNGHVAKMAQSRDRFPTNAPEIRRMWFCIHRSRLVSSQDIDHARLKADTEREAQKAAKGAK